ncbi:MAG: helix-turn-helix transcriptional regulator [Clostridia bacterium]|nr:helix-turn-helix transcriptional regulator [Clostridia bacterium]
MATKEKSIGELIKKARTDAGMTQAELARQVGGLTASDISKAERGQKDLSSALIQAIAGATGTSLLNTAIGALTGGLTTTAEEKKTVSIKVTESEKELLQLYRDADKDTKKKVVKLLKNDGNDNSDLITNILGGLISNLK